MFPVRRILFYLFYDREGIVDDYVPYKLTALREHVDYIFVVSNSTLTPESRVKLEAVADTVHERPNVGYDAGAFKEAMALFGSERLAEYDELILMNYTFFAPIFPFSETFERMDALDVDFWGITSHPMVDPNPFAGTTGILARHLQSHWLSVRKRMFTSFEFRNFFDSIPELTSYDEAILRYEASFTSYFEERGFTWDVAFPDTDYPTEHAVFESTPLTLAKRCPLIKRRQFFHESTYLERNAIIGRRVLEALEHTDYPIDLIWENVVRAAEPRHLYTNFSLLEVLPEADDGYRPDPAPRIVVLAHIYYDDMVPEIMSYVSTIPVPYDLVVTTVGEEKRESILRQLEVWDLASVEVRTVEDNRGRDTSALLIACQDVLTSGDYDLVCRVHSKKSPQDRYNVGNLFKHHLFDNLLCTPGYVAHLLGLFEKHPTLGMVFPPIVNIGYPTLGHAWFNNREPAIALAAELGITTVFDGRTPVAPYGSMFWARPEAMLKITSHPWTWSDFPDESGYRDGGLPHVIERLMAYAVLSSGYHIRSVINRDWASINYTFLEYKLQMVSSMLPAQTQEQIEYITEVSTEGPVLGVLKRAMDRRYPRAGTAIRPAYKVARATYHGARAVTRRIRPTA